MQKQGDNDFELLNMYNDEWEIDEGILYKCCLNRYTAIDSIRVPDGVVRINSEAFGQKVKSIYIPKSVKEICNGAFMGCANLKNIYIENPEIFLEKYSLCGSDLDSLEKVVIGGRRVDVIVTQSFLESNDDEAVCLEKYLGKDEIYYVDDDIEEIGTMAFNNCSNLKEVVLSKSVKRIHIYAFYPSGDSHLMSVELNDTLEYIDNWAFSGCNTISELRIPQSVVSIGKEAFYDWEDWQKIYVPLHFKKMRSFQKWRRGCNAEIIYY